VPGVSEATAGEQIDQHRASVADGGDEAADGGRHDGRPARLGLERDQAERLVVARHTHQVDGPVQVGERVAGLRRQEPHGVADAEFGGEFDERGRPFELLFASLGVLGV